jgi:hypothetical protein
MVIETKAYLCVGDNISVEPAKINDKRIVIRYVENGHGIALEMPAELAMLMVRDIKTNIFRRPSTVAKKNSTKICKNCKHINGQFCKLFWFEPVYRGDLKDIKNIKSGAINTCRYWEQKYLPKLDVKE